MTNDPLLCVIGAGRHASAHLYPNIGRVGAQLAGVCDLDREKAERNARRFGGRAYVDYERMLNIEAPDGVLICIGPDAHAELAQAVMKQGFAVYTEKPPASTAADAKQVLEVSNATGRLCMTAFKKRYALPYRHAHEWIRKHSDDARRSLSIEYASGPYHGGNFLLDFAIHAIDLVGYLFGAVEAVSATESRTEHAVYAVTLTFACGAIGTMTLSDARSFEVPTETVELTLDGGSWMSIENSARYRIVEDESPTAWHEPPTFVSAGEGDASTGHVRELEAFLNALTGGSEPPSSIASSYRSMVLYEAIEHAVNTNSVVTVDP